MKKYTLSAILVTILVLILNSAPILSFTLHPKDNLVFLGRRYVNSQDTYTYLSFIEQAKEGHLLFENLYTTEPQKPLLFRPSYLVIGHLAQLTNISSLTAYHVSRIILSLLFCLTLYRFLRYFFEDERQRFIAYALILTSSGLGIFLHTWFPNSLDLWIPEGNTFLSLAEAPHFILSQILMLTGYASFLRYLATKRISPLFFSTLSFLLLSFEHPFNLVVIAPILLVTALWSGVSWFTSILISGGSAIGLAYQYYSTLTNPILSTWQSQNTLMSPPITAYLLGYGFILILAIIQLEVLLKAKLTHTHKFTLTWIIVTSLLLYAPFNFQRRLIEGLHIPLSILATGGLFTLISPVRLKLQHYYLALVILLLSLTSIYMVYTDFKMINTDTQDNYYYHLSPAELNGITWLKQHTNESDAILSNWYLGNLIPGLIARKTYLGHQVQTAAWDDKNHALDIFVQNLSPAADYQFLESHGLTYVFISNNDILLKNGFKPENYSMLKPIYQADGVIIYKVN